LETTHIPIVEEQIPMNIKRGLKRIWVVGTVVWFFLCLMSFLDHNFKVFGLRIPELITDIYIIVVPLGSWVFLYVCFWISSGFSSDKKKDETNE